MHAPRPHWHAYCLSAAQARGLSGLLHPNPMVLVNPQLVVLSQRFDTRRPIIVWSARATVQALVVIASLDASAQTGGHRARLSADLAAQLADASDAPARVIVHG